MNTQLNKNNCLFGLIVLSVLLFICVLIYHVTSSAQKTNAINYHESHFKIKGKFTNKNNHKTKQQLTNSSGTSENEPWSNAFNFKKSWGSAVDPRTGIFSAYIKVGSLISNLGHGPNINLIVNYNSAALADKDTLGVGWSWNLTHFNLLTHQLTTSFGQNFYLKEQSDGSWWPRYHKLHDIQIQGNINTHLVITYTNGLRETLNHDGYEVRLEQQDGRGVNFSYESQTHLLCAVTDDEGHSILLKRTGNYITVISYGTRGQPVSVIIHQENHELRSVSLPSNNNHTSMGIYIHYIKHFISAIDYPTGLKEQVIYNCIDAMKMSRKNSALSLALCVVEKEMTDPGSEQPVIVHHYQYMQSNANGHNYLAYNSGLNITENLSKDILFEAPVDYSYRTQQDDGITREIRTYNKYHLLIDDKQISDKTGYALSDVHYFFCRTDQRNGCAHTSFTDLPATYSLPLKVVVHNWGEPSENPAITTSETTYDSLGRAIKQKDAYGRVTIVHYCPEKGDAACPATPKTWLFNAMAESILFYPARTDKNRIIPPVITRNYYRKEINNNGKGYTLVLDHQIRQSDKQQLITKYRYYSDHNNPLTYGLLKQMVLTGGMNDHFYPASIIKDYYIKRGSDYKKTTYSAIELYSGKRQLSSYVTTSLFTNQVVKTTDASGKNSILYDYDQWGRVTQEELAAGTPFTVRTQYQYTLSPEMNQVLIAAPNKRQQKVIFDGAGRQLMSFTEAVDSSGKRQPNHWWPIQKSRYDLHGRVTSKDHYMFDAFGHTVVLSTRQEYDDAGKAVKVHFPDGETQITRYDDASQCMVSYRQDALGKHSVVSVSRVNILNKPVKQWALPASTNVLLPLKSLCLESDKQSFAKVFDITYDGFGRQIAIRDPSGKIVRQYYDAMGRLTDTTDPVGNRIHQVYNLTGEVTQKWIFPVSGGRYLLSSAGYNTAGQLRWKAGEDGKRSFYTYTINGQLASVKTSAGHIFSWHYNVIGLPVNKWLDGKQQWSADYGFITYKLREKTDITGTTTYIYSGDNLLQRLIHHGRNNHPDYQLQWQYDNNRRTVSVSDISGNRTKTQYDSLGRIAKVYYQPYQQKHPETLYLPTYDSFSRLYTINYGSGMRRTVHYDRWGRQDKITDTLSAQLISQWKLDYDTNDNIVRIHQKAENNQYALLNYQYDTLDNLVQMTCKGSTGLPLCPRDTTFHGFENTNGQAPIIVRQNYTFTPLNRLAMVREILQNVDQKQTINKVMKYHYTNPLTPLRLYSVSSAWNQNKPVAQHLTYDQAGNMTVDGQNNYITYNASNQITRVITLAGKQSNYAYDGSGLKIMEKSSAGTSYLFYRGGTLINEAINSPGQRTHIIGYHGVAKTIDGTIKEYYENSYKGDVVGVFSKKNSDFYTLQQRNIYSPYGMVWHRKPVSLPLYQQTLQGFNGERTDPATGWQFLGNGNRTYNPKQRYFVSEDRLGDGYAFGSNNPVMNTDPDGNMPQWIGKWMGYFSTFGLSAIHQKWADIAGNILMAGIAATSLGLAVASMGSTILASAVTTGAALSGAVPVMAASLPPNKGLNIAASVIGVAESLVTTAVSAGLLGFGIYNVFSSIADASEATSSIEMTYVANGLMMSKTHRQIVSQTIVTYGIYASLAEQLKADPHLCNSVFYRLNQAMLRMNDTFLSRVWMSFLAFGRDKPNCIGCDSFCVLAAAKYTGKPINLGYFESFLKIRMETPQDEMLPANHPYEVALRKLFLPLKYTPVTAQFNLEEIFQHQILTGEGIRSAAIVRGVNHMGYIEVIRPDENSNKLMLATYVFTEDGTVSHKIVHRNKLNLTPFLDENSELKITGYVSL